MQKLIGTILFSCLFFILPAQPLKITHLTGDFYIYTTYNIYKGSPVPANGLYLVTNNGVAMIDTPWDSTQFQPLLDSIEYRHHKKVVLCIATHFHEDRTAGLEFYSHQGIKTYTTTQTDSICKKTNKKRAAFLLTKDSTFKLGQYRFQTFYGGQGHSPDNIVIWFEQAKILYGGCLIKSTEATDLGNLSDANVGAWTATLKKIQRTFQHPHFIIPGHDDWTSNQSLNHTLQLVKAYRQKNKK
jgi:glyoxylase-like metal-dependent hydrolase (beta-lactamase superfamily II)